MLSRWQKCLLGWLHHITPTFTRYTNFRPETLVGWHRRFAKHWWWMITLSGKRRSVGRPRIDASVEQIIVAIKTENPRYGTKLINLMVSEQLGVDISQATVRNVLKRQPRKPTKPTSPENSQGHSLVGWSAPQLSPRKLAATTQKLGKQCRTE